MAFQSLSSRATSHPSINRPWIWKLNISRKWVRNWNLSLQWLISACVHQFSIISHYTSQAIPWSASQLSHPQECHHVSAILTDLSESENSGRPPSLAASCGHYDRLSSDVKGGQLASEILELSSMAVSPTVNPVLQHQTPSSCLVLLVPPQRCDPNCPVKGMTSESPQGNSQVESQLSLVPYSNMFTSLGLITHFTIVCHTQLIYCNLSSCSSFRESFQKLIGLVPGVLTKMLGPKP